MERSVRELFLGHVQENEITSKKVALNDLETLKKNVEKCLTPKVMMFQIQTKQNLTPENSPRTKINLQLFTKRKIENGSPKTETEEIKQICRQIRNDKYYKSRFENQILNLASFSYWSLWLDLFDLSENYTGFIFKIAKEISEKYFDQKNVKKKKKKKKKKFIKK